MNMNTAGRQRARRRQGGFTLVELLVAMAIGGALMAGIVQVFIGSKATYRVVEDLSRIQENGRFAMDAMAWDVRMAGYRGCSSGVVNTASNTLKNSDNALYNFSMPVEGFDAVNRSFNDGYLSVALENARRAAASDNSKEDFELIDPRSSVHGEPDALIVRAAFGGVVRVHHGNNDKVEPASKKIEDRGLVERACPDGSNMRSGFCQGDIVMISNCSNARVFQITNMSNNKDKITLVHSSAGKYTPGNEISSWGGANAPESYGSGSEVVKVGTRIYFIANRLGLRGNLEPAPALFVLNENNEAEVLAENVEDMQISYGVSEEAGKMGLRVEKTDQTATEVAASADSWDTVVSAEIRLLMRSGNDFLTPDGQPQVYRFDQTPFSDHDDQRIRREFINTVTLRNRALH